MVGTVKSVELSPCQILSKSVKSRPTNGDFSIFEDGSRRQLGFLKFETFNGRVAQGPNCVASRNFVEIAQTAVKIW